MNAYKGLKNICEFYEDMNLSHYVDNNQSRLVLNNPDKPELKEQLTSTITGIRNAFVEIYHWVQGELYDLEAITDAINSREEISKNLTGLHKKKTSTQKDIDDLNAGNKTVGTMFKSKDDLGTLGYQMENLTKDIASTQTLLDLLTAYLGNEILPNLKADKLKLYRRVQQQFHVIEISNSHSIASFWSNVLKHDGIKAAS